MLSTLTELVFDRTGAAPAAQREPASEAPTRAYQGRRARERTPQHVSHDTVRLWLATLRHDIGCRGEHLSHGACHSALRLGRMLAAPPEALAELQDAATDADRPPCVRDAAREAAAQLLLNAWLAGEPGPLA